MEYGKKHHIYHLEALHQRLQVFVESVKIADTIKAMHSWEYFDRELYSQFLIPSMDLERTFFLESATRLPVKGISKKLHLSVHFPYKIEIENIGYLYSELLSGSELLGEMVGFDQKIVSFRLDPI